MAVGMSDDTTPRFAPVWLKRLVASIKQLPRLKRWLYFFGAPLLFIELGLFVATGLDANVKNVSGWRSAVDVAIATTDPFTVHTGFAVALAIASVFVVPAIIGVAAALLVEEQLRRMRQPREEIYEQLEGVKDQLRALEANRRPEHEVP
jgi:hypothetical protein